jgi:hypothetical protein
MKLAEACSHPMNDKARHDGRAFWNRFALARTAHNFPELRRRCHQRLTG